MRYQRSTPLYNAIKVPTFLGILKTHLYFGTEREGVIEMFILKLLTYFLFDQAVNVGFIKNTPFLNAQYWTSHFQTVRLGR